jgi:ribosome-binding factor A
MSGRQDKINELLKRLVAEFIERESNRDALISVTRVDISPDLKRALVYISVLPESKEEASLFFVKRQGTDLRTYIKNHAAMRTIPFLEFQIDLGEKNRARIDELEREEENKKRPG